ncbi:MAG TPA: histidine kinase dimerization/phospho-acceptor domain-containing protein [Gemmatimonadaceae bacterium]|nr:histidine kinase dimerization/phospho-acceptor domain-containing protein [Gemmatimonadaceae bacterium]
MTDDEPSSNEWLGTLQSLAARVAHEIRNPLNAVAVNLEVVRSRCERGNVDSPAVLPFATAAAGELERASRLIDALLAVARPGRSDLATLAGPVITLYDALASAEGGSVSMDLSAGSTGIEVAADDARAALAVTLDDMLGPGVAIRLHIAGDGDHVAARFSGPPVTPKLPVDVRLHSEPSGPTLLFPARTRGSAETE